MRLAVSGTHCCGKSTLIEAFLGAHPDFIHEPEPYFALEGDYGEVFAAEPSADDFYRQLEFNAGRLRHYQSGQRVIFERCPVDFLAYLIALSDLGRDGAARERFEVSRRTVVEALGFLDLIVFLPLNAKDGIATPDSEDPELRAQVDSRLVSIYDDADFDLFTTGTTMIVEASGSTAERLKTLERALLTGSPVLN